MVGRFGIGCPGLSEVFMVSMCGQVCPVDYLVPIEYTFILFIKFGLT